MFQYEDYGRNYTMPRRPIQAASGGGVLQFLLDEEGIIRPSL